MRNAWGLKMLESHTLFAISSPPGWVWVGLRGEGKGVLCCLGME